MASEYAWSAWTFICFVLSIITFYGVIWVKKEKTRRIERGAIHMAKRPFSAAGQVKRDNGGGGVSEVIIVGAGVAGSALAYTLGKDGRRVIAIERDLSEPDRMVGEVLHPGGYLKLIELGLEDCVENIDAQKASGLALYKNGTRTLLAYPKVNKESYDVSGECFHNGRFVQRMRQKAASLPNVQLTQGTVVSLVEEDGIVRGVKYKSKTGEELAAYASLTIVCDGCFSNIRRSLCDQKVKVHSYFVGMILKNCQLPFANYVYLIMAKPSPIIIYRISCTEVRCLVDFPGQNLPSVADGEMAIYLKNVIAPQIPTEICDSFIDAIDEGNIKSMPNKSMPASWYAARGAMLIGDAFNMRHPLTGGGMTVALSDIVILRDLLRPLHNLDDEIIVSKHVASFQILRKPLASTINAMAIIFYEVLCASADEAREAMRQACFDYLSLGGIFSSGSLALMLGLNPRPLSLILHCSGIVFCAAFGLLRPVPSLRRIWISLRVILVALGTLVPVIKTEGVRQMFFLMTVPTYYKCLLLSKKS